MKSKIYAISPDAAVEWERRRIEALARIPRAEISAEGRQEITEVMDYNREHIRQYLSMFYNQRQPMAVTNGVAYIHVNDYLGGGLTFIDRCMGASDYADILADIRAARADPAVKCALFTVDSGGGTAAGCVELGREAALLAREKDVYAYTDSLCCSAAYAIACAAHGLYASPSAMVGCIGTILTWMDYEQMLAALGLNPHIVANEGADLKATFTPYRAPTEAEQRHIQETADEYGLMFQEWVLSQPRTIKPEGFRGQALSGRESVAMGYLDGVASREEIVSLLEGIALGS